MAVNLHWQATSSFVNAAQFIMPEKMLVLEATTLYSHFPVG
jgi:hypothetical protein